MLSSFCILLKCIFFMALEVVQDLIDMSENHMNVQWVGDNSRLDTPLADFDALIWSAHSTPPVNKPMPYLDPDLQQFFRTEAGKALLTFGHIRGDVGADEISEVTMKRLRNVHGFNPLILSPAMGGRTLRDHNRFLTHEDVRLFPVPKDLELKLDTAYNHTMDTLFAYMSEFRDRLRLVIQPHTMGSGGFNNERVQKLFDDHAQIALLADTDFDEYQRRVVAHVSEWDDVYTDGCTNGPARPDVDILTGVQDVPGQPLRPLPDGGFGEHLQREFRAIGIEGQFNKPFSHQPGFPGTRLAEMAAEAGVPQVTFDLAKRHLVSKGVEFRASTFEPDGGQAIAIGAKVAWAALWAAKEV